MLKYLAGSTFQSMLCAVLTLSLIASTRDGPKPKDFKSKSSPFSTPSLVETLESWIQTQSWVLQIGQTQTPTPPQGFSKSWSKMYFLVLFVVSFLCKILKTCILFPSLYFGSFTLLVLGGLMMFYACLQNLSFDRKTMKM